MAFELDESGKGACVNGSIFSLLCNCQDSRNIPSHSLTAFYSYMVRRSAPKEASHRLLRVNATSLRQGE